MIGIAAGMEAPPGNTKPIVSAIDVIVDAVPIVMQFQNDLAMTSSTSLQSSSVILPSLKSS